MVEDEYFKCFGRERPSITYTRSIRTEWIISEKAAEEINNTHGEGTVKPGDKGYQLSAPKNIEEAWERLTSLHAQSHFEYLQIKLFKAFKDPSKEIIQEKLTSINNFIVYAESESIENAFNFTNRYCSKQEYLRLKYGYYKTHLWINQHGDISARIYGEHILFKAWLEVLLKTLHGIIPDEHTYDEETGSNKVYSSPTSPNQGAYTYTHLIDVLNGIYDEKQILEQSNINWGQLAKGATDSIIEKLYHFENDSQRTGFLNSVFTKIFCDGKDYNFSLEHNEGREGFENELDFEYVKNCRLVLNELIDEVSQACIQYEGVDFSLIMKPATSTYGAKPGFSWVCRKPVVISDLKEEVSTNHIQPKSLILDQVALIHVYKKINILDPRSDLERQAAKIAELYGFTSGTSGEQLYKKFRKLDGPSSQRTGVKNKEKMATDIETILPHLFDDALNRAKIELLKLRESKEKE